MGLSAAIATAGQSLQVFSAGIQVAGQNISNANTPGYIREKLVIGTNDPYRTGNLILGTGSQAQGVRQVIDKYLQSQLYGANADVQGAATRQVAYTQLETSLQALGTNSLSGGLSDFLSQLNSVANQPETLASRQLAVSRGVQFANQISTLRTTIDQQRATDNSQVKSLVSQANSLIDQIAQLNPQIVSMESAGLGNSDAGGLRSQQYEALTQLSQIIPVKVTQQQNGSYNVFLGGDYLVLESQSQHLQASNAVDRGVGIVNVSVQNTNTPVNGTSGQLGGLLNSRDQILGGFTDKLDTFTNNLISTFNNIYSSGQGADAYTTVTGTNAVSDTTASLATAGLKFPPQTGSFQINVTNSLDGTTQTATIPVNLSGPGSQTSLSDLQTAIGNVGNLTASLTPDGRLTIAANSGYKLSFANDTSGTLTGLGINTFFTGSDSHDIGVNSTVITNPNLFAAGQGGGAADGSNALQLAQFADRPVAGLNNLSLNDFNNSTTAQVAQDSASTTALSQGYQGYLDSLTSQQSQYSGVSLDDEAISVIKYQQGYQAAAKFISTVDELFSELLKI